MKKFLGLLAVCFSLAVANAQITTGESTSQVIRTGNRAQAGNFGIYFGATTNVFKSIGNFGDADISAIPLINLKYMKSDKLEYRLGIEWWKKTSSTEDKVLDVNDEGEEVSALCFINQELSDEDNFQDIFGYMQCILALCMRR